MLKTLKIKNYALIKKVELDFSKQMTVITGETGAGKSIMLGALSLVMGKRADLNSLHDKEKKCIVEAEFKLKDTRLKPFFDENDLDFEQHTVIRRELLPSGKSRAFVNDTPVNLKVLAQLASFLIDLHQQFDTLDIHQVDFHIQVIDALADNGKLMEQYQASYQTYIQLQRTKQTLIQEQETSLKEKDFISFQLSELLNAEIIEEEQEELEQELKLMEHAGTIKQTLGGLYNQILEGEHALLGQMDTIRSRFQQVESLTTDLQKLGERIDSMYFEMQEIGSELEQMADRTDIDGHRMQEVQDRLDVLFKLQNKHFVSGSAALLSIQEDLQTKIDGFVSIDEELERVSSELQVINDSLVEQAHLLREKRHAVIPFFQGQVVGQLALLNMPYASFEVHMGALSHPGPSGLDSMEFKFNANKGGLLQSIKEVASGGELSRLTLVIKSLVASAIPLPTMIFDEIDTGISGDVALKMGRMLEQLAEEHQIVTITHSPQIGSKGKLHYFVYKEVGDNQTYSNIRKLNVDERVGALAVMLSQDPPSKSAIANAKELLAN